MGLPGMDANTPACCRLRIRDITALPTSVPTPPHAQIDLGFGRSVKRDAVLVRVRIEEGLVGWSESHHGRAYYALLPKHPDNAWSRLGPALQAQGRTHYEESWKSVSAATVITQPRTIAPNTVLVGIELTMRDHSKNTEFHKLGLVVTDGKALINADTFLHREHSPSPRPSPTTTRHTKDDKEGK